MYSIGKKSTDLLLHVYIKCIHILISNDSTGIYDKLKKTQKTTTTPNPFPHIRSQHKSHKQKKYIKNTAKNKAIKIFIYLNFKKFT